MNTFYDSMPSTAFDFEKLGSLSEEHRVILRDTILKPILSMNLGTKWEPFRMYIERVFLSLEPSLQDYAIKPTEKFDPRKLGVLLSMVNCEALVLFSIAVEKEIEWMDRVGGPLGGFKGL